MSEENTVFDPVGSVFSDKNCLSCIFRFFDAKTLMSAVKVNRKWRTVAAPKLSKLKSDILDDLKAKGVDLELVAKGFDFDQGNIPPTLRENHPLNVNKLLRNIRGIKFRTLLYVTRQRVDIRVYRAEETLPSFIHLYALAGSRELIAAIKHIYYEEMSNDFVLNQQQYFDWFLPLVSLNAGVDTFNSVLALEAHDPEDSSRKFFENDDLTRFNNCLEYACRNGNWPLVKYFLDNGKDNYGFQTRLCCRALAMSMEDHQIELVHKIEKNYKQHLDVNALGAGRADQIKFMLMNAALESDSVECFEKYCDMNAVGVDEQINGIMRGDALNIFKYLLSRYGNSLCRIMNPDKLLDKTLHFGAARILSFILDHPDCDVVLSDNPSQKHPSSEKLLELIDKITNFEVRGVLNGSKPTPFQPVIKKYRLTLGYVEREIPAQEQLKS